MKNLLFAISLFTAGCGNHKDTIHSLEFQAGPCFGECPIFNIAISENGAASLDAIEFNPQSGHFKAVIPKIQMDSLNMLVQQLNLNNLDTSYTTNATDMSSCQLKISLKGGFTKAIYDYGNSGPKELNALYEYLFSLRTTLKWQMVK